MNHIFVIRKVADSKKGDYDTTYVDNNNTKKFAIPELPKKIRESSMVDTISKVRIPYFINQELCPYFPVESFSIKTLDDGMNYFKIKTGDMLKILQEYSGIPTVTKENLGDKLGEYLNIHTITKIIMAYNDMSDFYYGKDPLSFNFYYWLAMEYHYNKLNDEDEVAYEIHGYFDWEV